LVAIKNFFANFTQLRVLFFAVDFTFDVRKSMCAAVISH
jgi:hypothetical protein